MHFLLYINIFIHDPCIGIYKMYGEYMYNFTQSYLHVFCVSLNLSIVRPTIWPIVRKIVQTPHIYLILEPKHSIRHKINTNISEII
jgi:hypothetical protein